LPANLEHHHPLSSLVHTFPWRILAAFLFQPCLEFHQKHFCGRRKISALLGKQINLAASNPHQIREHNKAHRRARTGTLLASLALHLPPSQLALLLRVTLGGGSESNFSHHIHHFLFINSGGIISFL
jgi:hypothetical protein